MSERKVLNKYFPPDFDPKKIPRLKDLPRDLGTSKVRLMAPFSMQCTTCGNYIYKGKKFNARKEPALGEFYLGIQIFVFHIRCPNCIAYISFKTDPERSDYKVDKGAQRNFEPWRDDVSALEKIKAEKDKAEENNPMKALENRTLASKREMDIMDALDEIRTRNAKLERQSASVLETSMMSVDERENLLKKLLDEEDDRLAKEAFSSIHSNSIELDEALALEEEDDEIVPLPSSSQSVNEFKRPDPKPKVVKPAEVKPPLIMMVKKRTVSSTNDQEQPLKKPKESKGESQGLSSLADYGSDSD